MAVVGAGSVFTLSAWASARTILDVLCFRSPRSAAGSRQWGACSAFRHQALGGGGPVCPFWLSSQRISQRQWGRV